MSYITQIGEDTYKAATQGLYALVCRSLLGTETEQFAGEMAAAVALSVWEDSPTDKRHLAFHEEHRQRIEAEMRKPYLHAPSMQEILSGAAYNIGYGRYVAAGGSRLLNKFLGYIRSDSIPNKSKSDWEVNTSLYEDLSNRSTAILRPITSLKRLSLWKPRCSNPNEQEYYRAVCAFAQQAITGAN